MNQLNILELAQQGDVNAIIILLNNSSQLKGITTKVTLKDKFLQVILEGDKVPEQEESVTSIKQLITQSEIEFITKLKVFGRRKGAIFHAWNQELQLKDSNNSQQGFDLAQVPESERLVFYGALFAMAAADGSISPEESTLILESIDINNLSEPGKRLLNSYIVKAPSLEDCLRKLSKADELLKWSLIFYLLQIAWVDNSLDVGEEQAIKLTQTTFQIKDTQLQAMQEFIQILKSISESKIDGKQSIEILNNATSVVVAEGIPLLGLFKSGNTNNFTASKNYSEDKFWDKLKKFAIMAGKEVVEKVLLLYYTLQQPNVPIKVKAIITGALGYFIMPFDIAPDFIPGVGLGDDITALVAALATVAMYITPEVKEAVKQKMQELFGNT